MRPISWPSHPLGPLYAYIVRPCVENRQSPSPSTAARPELNIHLPVARKSTVPVPCTTTPDDCQPLRARIVTRSGSAIEAAAEGEAGLGDGAAGESDPAADCRGAGALCVAANAPSSLSSPLAPTISASSAASIWPACR